uniref:Myosin light chain kinase family member 4-like n=1 Tax=Phallusia mammillata TaxID=59560 RepID=A0A6F9DLX8_9ASCI|nr:myosin light chain kinase family member 4-like [Phallusia mammillata]
MSEELKKIQLQLTGICSAFSHITQIANTVLRRLDDQDQRLDFISNQLKDLTSKVIQNLDNEEAQKGATIKEHIQPSASATTATGVNNVINTKSVDDNCEIKSPLVSCKSSPALLANDISQGNTKKQTKKGRKRATAAHSPPCRQRHNRHVMQRRESKTEIKESKSSDKPAIVTKEKIISKKFSCESGVFSSDDLCLDDTSDDVIYQALSEEEIEIVGSGSDQQDDLEDDKTSISAPPSRPASTNNVMCKPVTPESADRSDEDQVQNSNHAATKAVCVVRKNSTNEVEIGLCDVTERLSADAKGTGAKDDDKTESAPKTLAVGSHLEGNDSHGHTLLNVMGHTLQEGRRASYAGLTLQQKQKILSEQAEKSTDSMTPASISTSQPPRPHSSCATIPRNDTMKSDVGDTLCMDRRLIDVKRQFSNSSTNSAPGGIQITIGPDTESEDDDVEIKLPDIPSPPFSYRAVTVKNSTYKHFYELKEQLGGGRFGKVYRCVEKKTGLQLAAKCFVCKKPVPKSLLKSKSLKRAPQNLKTKRTQQEPVEKDDVMIEISIMNLIDNENVVKLYDAFENDNTMTLIMEYLEGGELFERVLADQSQLTELDAVLFMRQIIKAVQYLHKNLILHLDLKPENILCLDRTTHHIKIIDFGLARKYIPRQKLVVQWGTPEFMAPEVLNYEVVSFPSDMWSVGVICYILLSGISPFLGDSDSETMENIADCAWDFDEHPFKNVSEEAKDFISRLLVIAKSGRMSATQCLRHEWLATPLTTRRRKALMNKRQLKDFMARMHWKASVAALTAASWLRGKVNTSGSDSDLGSAV